MLNGLAADNSAASWQALYDSLPGVKATAPGSYGSGNYDPVTGRYLGGNFWMDLYCGSFLGSSDAQCTVPTPNQIRTQQIAELQTTSAPAPAQAAAIAAGDAAVAADMAAHPADYQAQCVAANHPALASTLGTSLAGSLFPTDANCNSTTPWLLIGIAGVAALALFGAMK
jgi:hypothetical protein